MSRTYQEHPILFAAYCPGKIMALHANPQNIGIEVFGFALSQDHAGKLNTVHLIHFVNSVTIDDILKGLKVGKEQFPSNVEFSERLRVIESVKEMLDHLQGGKITLPELEIKIAEDLKAFRLMYYTPEYPLGLIQTSIYDDMPSP